MSEPGPLNRIPPVNGGWFELETHGKLVLSDQWERVNTFQCDAVHYSACLSGESSLGKSTGALHISFAICVSWGVVFMASKPHL